MLENEVFGVVLIWGMVDTIVTGSEPLISSWM
jgi:hypothetical protein